MEKAERENALDEIDIDRVIADLVTLRHFFEEINNGCYPMCLSQAALLLEEVKNERKRTAGAENQPDKERTERVRA